MTTASVHAPAPVAPALTDHPLVASCDSKTLAAALAFVSTALPSRPPMQVLLGITLRATPDGITLGGFDYERTFIEVIDGVGTGEALVPGQLLKDVVKALDPGTIQLVVDAEVKNLVITQGDLEFGVPLLSLPDYPAPPKPKGKVAATLTGADLTDLNRVTVAAGRDETLPILTCIRLENEQGKLRSVATDRYRLAVSTTQVPSKLPEDARMNLPAKSFAQVAKHLAKSETVRLQYDEGFVTFDAGQRKIVVRVVEGEFPRYRTLIPDSTDVKIEVDSAAMLKGVSQVAIVAARNAPVRFDITDEHLMAEAGGHDDAKASKKIAAVVTGLEQAAADVAFNPFIAFNPGYLFDGVTAVSPKGRVRIDFASSTRPSVFTAHDDTDRSFIYLLMPVKLSG